MTVVELSDLFSQGLAPLAAYISPITAGNSDWRRIIPPFDETTGVLTLNRAVPGSIVNGQPVDIYLILPRPDWRTVVNNALAALYFTEHVSITIVESQSLYAMPTGAEWIQTEQQIQRVVFKWTVNGSIEKQDAPVFDVIEDVNAISLNFPVLPTDVDAEIEIEARHFCEPLATDASTTTCPARLIKAQARVEGLRRIWNMIGDAHAKDLFGAEMRQAEAELLDAKKQQVRQVSQRPLHMDRAQPGPEMAMRSYRW